MWVWLLPGGRVLCPWQCAGRGHWKDGVQENQLVLATEQQVACGREEREEADRARRPETPLMEGLISTLT